MNTTQSTATGEMLDAQLEMLGAVQVGETKRCPYYALPFEGYPAESGWYTFSRDAALEALAQANKEGQDDFTACLNGSNTVQMPSWWSPEQRFALVPVVDAGLHRRSSLRLTGTPEQNEQARREAARRGEPWYHLERITASLETGEEVPA